MILRTRILVNERKEECLKLLIFKQAVAIGLCGWVKNDKDNMIVVEAQGDEQRIGNFRRTLSEMPHVREEILTIEQIEIDESEKKGFRIG